MQDDHEAGSGAEFLVPSVINTSLPPILLVPSLLQTRGPQESEADADAFEQEYAAELDFAVLWHGPDPEAGDGSAKEIRNRPV